MKKYVVVTKSPALSGKARKYGWGYRKIALVETTDGQEPKMISERCKTVVRVLDVCSLYYGKGIKSEGAKYLAELQEKAKKLNDEN